MKILIADRDRGTLASLKENVGTLFPECEIVCFENPIQLFGYLPQHKAETVLVITPAVSNIGDGFRLIEVFGKSPISPPVFLTSQGENEELERLARIRGASGFLSKPIMQAALKRVFDEWYQECSECGEWPCNLPCLYTGCVQRSEAGELHT